MLSGINSNSISSLQVLRASNAFKPSKAKANENELNEQTEINEQPEKISLKSDFVTESKLNNLNPQSISEIKDFAKKIDGELSEDDIKYGFMYGRSVMVDYTA